MYTTSSTSYSLSWLTKGTAYSVKVIAIADSEAYTDSDWSSDITVINAYKTPLSAPSFSVSASSSSAIAVAVGSVPNATSYTLQYSTSSSFSGVVTKTVLAGTIYITGLSANTTYYFRVKANTTATYYADSAYSSYKSCTTKKITLGTPTISVLIAVSATEIAIEFDKVSNANRYIIEYSTSPNFSTKETMPVTG